MRRGVQPDGSFPRSRSDVAHGLTTGLAILVLLVPLPCLAIEMFTFFGDGSRIGLPSLEVPVEAYRGIPLRSDRLRARRGSRRSPAADSQMGPPGALVRVIPETVVPPPAAPLPRRNPPTPPRGTAGGHIGRPAAPLPAFTDVPVAPEPLGLEPSGKTESIPAPRD